MDSLADMVGHVIADTVEFGRFQRELKLLFPEVNQRTWAVSPITIRPRSRDTISVVLLSGKRWGARPAEASQDRACQGNDWGARRTRWIIHL